MRMRTFTSRAPALLVVRALVAGSSALQSLRKTRNTHSSFDSDTHLYLSISTGFRHRLGSSIAHTQTHLHA